MDVFVVAVDEFKEFSAVVIDRQGKGPDARRGGLTRMKVEAVKPGKPMARPARLADTPG